MACYLAPKHRISPESEYSLAINLHSHPVVRTPGTLLHRHRRGTGTDLRHVLPAPPGQGTGHCGGAVQHLRVRRADHPVERRVQRCRRFRPVRHSRAVHPALRADQQDRDHLLLRQRGHRGPLLGTGHHVAASHGDGAAGAAGCLCVRSPADPALGREHQDHLRPGQCACALRSRGDARRHRRAVGRGGGVLRSPHHRLPQ